MHIEKKCRREVPIRKSPKKHWDCEKWQLLQVTNGRPPKAMDDGRRFLGDGCMMTKMATSRY